MENMHTDVMVWRVKGSVREVKGDTNKPHLDQSVDKFWTTMGVSKLVPLG